MTRLITLSELEEEIKFVKMVAIDFALHPEHDTFGDMTPNSLLAVRWSMSGRGVLVTRIEDNEPRVYQDVVKEIKKC